jgi:hypothetical protein
MAARGITAKAILVCAATNRVVVMHTTDVFGRPIDDLPGGKWDPADGRVARADDAALRACAFRTVRREIAEELPGLDAALLAVVGGEVFRPAKGKGWALFLVVAPRIGAPLAVSDEHTGARLVPLRAFRVPRRWLRHGPLGAWLTVAGPLLLGRYAQWRSGGGAADIGAVAKRAPVRARVRLRGQGVPDRAQPDDPPRDDGGAGGDVAGPPRRGRRRGRRRAQPRVGG